tara:strand:- start:228 stop:1043 length:816 start_codon:yes stop_codon:yes gene_type:complete
MKVFVDVGSNYGQTLKVISNKKYNFDKIFGFEPSKKCFANLDKIAAADKRIKICKFGLGLKNCKVDLFEPGLMSASIFKSDDNITENSNIEKEEIKIVDAAKWVKDNLSKSDINVAKINVEGSEIDILRSWLDSECINYFYSIVIMFDIREFKKYRHLEREIRNELNSKNFYNYCDADDIVLGNTHEKRLNNWLSTFGLDTDINSKEKLLSIYGPILKKYSKKTGKFYEIEVFVKELISYKSFPETLKKPFRFLKKIVGKNKEANLEEPRN